MKHSPHRTADSTPKVLSADSLSNVSGGVPTFPDVSDGSSSNWYGGGEYSGGYDWGVGGAYTWDSPSWGYGYNGGWDV